MALEGSLREFGLADILQLLYFQRKTGVLTVHSRLDKVRLLFHEGNIVSAESSKRDVGSRVGRVLLKKGIISPDDFKTAIEEHKRTGQKFGAVLINKGFASEEDIKEVLTFQLTETVTQLFSWKEGKYEFVPQGVPSARGITLSLDTQHLLMDGLRLHDEWSIIEGKISLDSVFEKTGESAEGLNDEEQEIFGLVDGSKDVYAITDLTGLESFQVSKTLIALVEKGVIAPKGVGEEEAPAVKATKRQIPGLSYITALAVAAALVLSVFLFRGTDRLKGYNASEEIDELRYSIEAAKEEKGVYPASLEKADPWGNPYVYKVTGNGFVLKSPGPDGQPGTEDDIY
jgi:hypothetical protein